MLFRYPFVAMGSGCELLLAGDHEREVLGAVHSALAEVQRLEARYSLFREDSLLAALNREAPHRAVPLDAETARLLAFADALYTATDGAFDPTVGTLHGLWDFRTHHPADPTALWARLPAVGWRRHVELSGGTLRLHHPDTRLDLGGIVKEYALDTTAAVLAALGIRRGLVNLGGDLKLVGRLTPGDRPFRVGIAHPRRHHATVASAQLTEGALVTSGDYQRYFLRDGRRYHHVLDPGTGEPAALATPGATAQAASALEALAACKGLLLRGTPPTHGAWLRCAPDGEPAAWAEGPGCRFHVPRTASTPGGKQTGASSQFAV